MNFRQNSKKYQKDTSFQEEHIATVRRYYERNTKMFLALGGGNRTRSIHRAVWGEGVTTRTEAFDYPNALIREEIRRLPSAPPLRILDLGCGVGGSLFYLARHLDGLIQATGITISPLQVQLARQTALQLRMQDQCNFLEASYIDIPELPPMDLSFAIEAFIATPDVDRFFAQAAGALKPGGRLILCDDFLTNTGASCSCSLRQQGWLRQFREGWDATGLVTKDFAVQRAAAHHLALCADRDLTPYLELRRPRDRLLAGLLFLGRFLPLRGTYWKSLLGGHALQQCLLAGIVAYHFLVFKKIE